jgi:serine/threonine-protein kinase
VVLYELTVGSAPFTGSLLARMHAIVEGDFPAPAQQRPAYPVWLEAIVRRALARAPVDRFDSASAMATALRDAARAHGCTPSPARLAALAPR